jgi:hypothetical protein
MAWSISSSRPDSYIVVLLSRELVRYGCTGKRPEGRNPLDPRSVLEVVFCDLAPVNFRKARLDNLLLHQAKIFGVAKLLD